jgi:hypothetical protein
MLSPPLVWALVWAAAGGLLAGARAQIEANTWTAVLTDGAAPAARSEHAMARDPRATGDVVLFGGTTSSLNPAQTLFADTWVYHANGNVWQRVDAGPAGPAARAGHSLVEVPGSDAVALFGGLADPDGAHGGGALADVWYFRIPLQQWVSALPLATAGAAAAAAAAAAGGPLPPCAAAPPTGRPAAPSTPPCRRRRPCTSSAACCPTAPLPTPTRAAASGSSRTRRAAGRRPSARPPRQAAASCTRSP